MPLVWEVGKTNIARQLSADNIPGVIDSLGGCRCSVRRYFFSDGNFIKLLAKLRRLGAGRGTVGVWKQNVLANERINKSHFHELRAWVVARFLIHGCCP